MRRFNLFVAAWTLVMLAGALYLAQPIRVAAQTAGGFVPPGPGAAPDPCSYAPHNSVPISTATSATFLVIPGKTGTGNITSRETSVCNVNVSIAASSTLKLEQCPQGTTTGCTPLSGAWTAVLPHPANATVVRANAGNDIIAITTGTGVQGSLTFVYDNQQVPLAPTPTPWAAATPT